MIRSTSAYAFSNYKNISKQENETEKVNQNNIMTKTTIFNYPFRKNKKYTINTSVLNDKNNVHSNISLISSLNEFNTIKSGLQLNNSYKTRTTKNKYRKLIHLQPESYDENINIDKINFFKKPNVPRNLDVLNLILKHSPEKINMKLVAQKMNILNRQFKNKTINSTSKKFYDYNVIFGYKSNNIIKSYTPKLKLKKPGKTKEVNKTGVEFKQILNDRDISALFNQQCFALNIHL